MAFAKVKMMTLKVILVALWATSISATSPDNFGFLDLEELENLQYSISIESAPIRMGDPMGVPKKEAAEGAFGNTLGKLLGVDNLDSLNGLQIGGTEAQPEDDPNSYITMPIINKFGQRYQCMLPKTSLEMDSSKDEEGKEENEKVAEDKPIEIKELLEPMAKGACLFKTRDWWTYEFCYGQEIRQYHMEDNKPSGAIMSLGKYDHDYEWNSEKKESATEGIVQSHHSQFYTNGSVCDLTGKLRKSEVRFICGSNHAMDSILMVDEPQSCEYVIKVVTNKVCAFPQLKPKPTKKPKEILCAPVLSEEQYEKYQAFQKEQARLEEIKVAKKRQEEKDRMIKILGHDQDLSSIDADSEEGYKQLQKMMQEKMTEKLMSQLETIFADEDILNGGALGGPGSFAVRNFYADDLFGEDLIQRREGVGATKADFLKMVEDVARKRKRSNIEKRIRDAIDVDREVQENSGIKKLEVREPVENRVLDIDEQEAEEMRLEEGALDDLEMERKVRSDVVGQKEMMDELKKSYSELDQGTKDLVRAVTESDEFEKELENGIKDIIKESEQELGAQMDNAETGELLAEHKDQIRTLLNQLDEAEAKLARVNKDIDKVQNFIEEREQEMVDVAKEDDDDVFPEDEIYDEELPASLKRDGKRSVKKELRDEDVEEMVAEKAEHLSPIQDGATSDNIKVKVTDINSAVSGLDGTASNLKVTKRLEGMIKEKLTKSGIDTGGRQIEVKLVTSTVDLGDLGQALQGGGAGGGEMTGEEQQQFQNMVYNLMTGNTAGFQDIDHQRKSERNYKFSWDETLLDKTKQSVESSDASQPTTSPESTDSDPETTSKEPKDEL